MNGPLQSNTAPTRVGVTSSYLGSCVIKSLGSVLPPLTKTASVVVFVYETISYVITPGAVESLRETTA